MSTPDTGDRCTLVGLPLDDPLASARDPALAALMREGWRPLAHFPAERSGKQELVLLLAPPRPEPPAPARDLRVVELLLLLVAAATVADIALRLLGV